MPAVHEPTSWGVGATGAPNDMVFYVLRAYVRSKYEEGNTSRYWYSSPLK